MASAAGKTSQGDSHGFTWQRWIGCWPLWQYLQTPPSLVHIHLSLCNSNSFYASAHVVWPEGCLCIRPCILNTVNTICWKVLDILSPNFQHWWYILGKDSSFGGQKVKVQGHCASNMPENNDAFLEKDERVSFGGQNWQRSSQHDWMPNSTLCLEF